MRSTFLLLKDIQAALKERFAYFPFDAPDKAEEPLRVPNAWIGHAPPKKSIPTGAPAGMPAGDPPFLIVRPLDGEHKLDSSRAKVNEVKIGVLCCVYSKDSYEDIEAGYHDILNMMDRVLVLFAERMQWEENHWFIPPTEPIKWALGLQEELNLIYKAGLHDHPCYGAAVIATFRATGIQQSPIAGITG
jgi:hypothetical protein